MLSSSYTPCHHVFVQHHHFHTSVSVNTANRSSSLCSTMHRRGPETLLRVVYVGPTVVVTLHKAQSPAGTEQLALAHHGSQPRLNS